ncbi:MAG: uroporphyrinogen-III C-methyltransferase [Succinivibrio sp.]|nr:uroporphyrinogen-III C-methyltransferase [Succinivibrio sp.]
MVTEDEKVPAKTALEEVVDTQPEDAVAGKIEQEAAALETQGQILREQEQALRPNDESNQEIVSAAEPSREVEPTQETVTDTAATPPAPVTPSESAAYDEQSSGATLHTKKVTPQDVEYIATRAVDRSQANAMSQELKSVRWRTGFLSFLVLLLIAAIATGAFYCARYLTAAVDSAIDARVKAETSESKLQDATVQLQARLDKVEGLVAQNAALQADIQRLREGQDKLDGTIEGFNQTFAGINTRLDRYESRNPDEWRVAQSYFLVNNAFEMAVFSQNFQAALWCLGNADTLLANIEDAELVQIRKALNHDILELNSLPSIDKRGIGFKIDGIYDNLANMTLNGMQSGLVLPGSGEGLPEEESWQENVLKAAREFSSRFVEIRRLDDQALNQFLSPEQAEILRRNIQSLLLLAKMALYQGDDDSYHSALNQSEELIKTYYDKANDVFKANISALDSIKDLRISIDAPSVLTSYALFRDYVKNKLRLITPNVQTLPQEEQPLQQAAPAAQAQGAAPAKNGGKK